MSYHALCRVTGARTCRLFTRNLMNHTPAQYNSSTHVNMILKCLHLNREVELIYCTLSGEVISRAATVPGGGTLRSTTNIGKHGTVLM